jgi:hypothetical protein
MMDRDEHLAWCKKRALEYWRAGDLSNAVASMGSDLGKHDETRHASEALIALGILYVVNGDYDGVKRWIEGFR